MSAKQTRQLAHLRDLCALPLPSAQWMPELLAELHRLVPSHRNLFDWCDGDGRLTRYCIEGPIDTRIERLYFDEFHNRREAEAMPSFGSALRGPALLHSARELDTARFIHSALYHEIWRPQGLRWRVELLLREACGRPLGSLVLYRAPGEPCFTPAEEARLLPLLPHLVRALGSESAAHRAGKDGWQPSLQAPETLLLDAGGAVVHASSHALVSLRQADDGQAVPGLTRLLQACAGRDAAELTVDGIWGRFVLRAQRLRACTAAGPGSPAFMAVQLQRHEPRSLA
ncbi:MAG: hypothetical protein J0L58_11050, partial [Burkholderiales bacterium]|nr:hypothetical protein [Burkholderiales bacterium]